MTVHSAKVKPGRGRWVAVAAALTALGIAGSTSIGAGPPAAAAGRPTTTTTVPATTTTTSPTYANQFRGQYAYYLDHNATGYFNSVKVVPGKDDANGSITEYLNTAITGTFCFGGTKGFLLETSLQPKAEQGGDLSGVALNTLASSPTATVARTINFTGTVTKTPKSGANCTKARNGTPVTTTNPDITVNTSWSKLSSANLMTYSGTDCGGTGTCRHTDATATASLVFTGTTFPLGGLTSTPGPKWMWSGNWNLDATCSPVPGYEC